MHELATSEAIVSEVCERVGATSVVRVVLEIGRLSGVVPDAVGFCFDLAARNTILEGAALEIAEIPGLARCRACHAEGEDKPLKYPHMFRASDVVPLNKVDLLPHVSFDGARFVEYARRIVPELQVFEVSATRGDGFEAWTGWLEDQMARCHQGT